MEGHQQLLRIVVESIRGLVPRPGLNPYLIVKFGEFIGETPCGIPSLEESGEWDIWGSLVFPGNADAEDLIIEICDSSLGFIAGGSISNWRPYLRDNKRTLMLDLKPEGSVRVEMRIIPNPVMVSQKAHHDRLNIFLASLSGMAANVKNPIVYMKISENAVVGSAEPRKGVNDMPGYFEYNESHTFPYHQGDQVLEIHVRNHDDVPIGSSRFNLGDLACADKTHYRIAGTLSLTDSRGQVIGSLLIAAALWDSTKVTGKAKEQTGSLDKLKRHLEWAEKLRSEFPPSSRTQRAETKLSNAHTRLLKIEELHRDLAMPNKSKSSLKATRNAIKNEVYHTESELQECEYDLQALAMEVATQSLAEAERVRGQLLAMLRNAGVSGDKSSPRRQAQSPRITQILDDSRPFLHDAEKLIDDINYERNNIKHKTDSEDNYASLRRISNCVNELRGIEEEAVKVDFAIAESKKESRLVERQRAHLVTRAMNGTPTIPVVVERPAHTFADIRDIVNTCDNVVLFVGSATHEVSRYMFQVVLALEKLYPHVQFVNCDINHLQYSRFPLAIAALPELWTIIKGSRHGRVVLPHAPEYSTQLQKSFGASAISGDNGPPTKLEPLFQSAEQTLLDVGRNMLKQDLILFRASPHGTRCSELADALDINEYTKLNEEDKEKDLAISLALNDENWTAGNACALIDSKACTLGDFEEMLKDHKDRVQELSQRMLNALDDRIRALQHKSDVMLFMKGTKAAPFCKFSKAIVQILHDHGIDDFEYFNVLTDEKVRDRNKSLARWPTYPQLWVKGQLVGGLDVLKDMIQEAGPNASLRTILGLTPGQEST